MAILRKSYVAYMFLPSVRNMRTYVVEVYNREMIRAKERASARPLKYPYLNVAKYLGTNDRHFLIKADAPPHIMTNVKEISLAWIP